MAESILRRTVRAALYGRISTQNHGPDVGMQLRELREYCERRGREIAAEYVDVGINGAKERRPRLDELMRDAHRCRFSAIRLALRSHGSERNAFASRPRDIPSAGNRFHFS